MPVLSVGQPLESKAPVLLVENKLAVGQHRFSLVVVDDSGNESAPDVLVVTVRRPGVPPVRPRSPSSPVLRPGAKP